MTPRRVETAQYLFLALLFVLGVLLLLSFLFDVIALARGVLDGVFEFVSWLASLLG